MGIESSNADSSPPSQEKKLHSRRGVLKFLAGLTGFASVPTPLRAQTLRDLPSLPVPETGDLMDTTPGTKESRLELVGEILSLLKSGPTHTRSLRNPDEGNALAIGTTVITERPGEMYYTSMRPFWKKDMYADVRISHYNEHSGKSLPAFSITLEIRRERVTPDKRHSRSDGPLSIKWSSDTDLYRISIDGDEVIGDFSEGAAELKDLASRFPAEVTPTLHEKILLDRLLNGIMKKVLGTS